MGRIIEMPLPRLGETMDEGRIGIFVKQPGEKFRRGETLLEVESDKTTVEVPALQDGILIEWLVAADEMVPVESAIARIEIEGEAVAEVKRAAVSPEPSPRRKPGPPEAPKLIPGFRRDDGQGVRPRASTAARAAARRSGIDLATMRGSGRHGRVTRADLAAVSRPARTTYHAETPQGKIFFREWPAQGVVKGNALLIHGLFADSQSFTTLGRKLAAKGYRAFALDLPGHGETLSAAVALKDIVAAVEASLPPVRLHVVAHSFGAIIAARLLHKALSLTLLSPAGCGEDINGAFVAAMLGGHIEQALSFLGETVPAESQAAFADHLTVHGGQLKAIAAHVSDGGKQTVSIVQSLAKSAVPVQAIFLRDDAIIPSQHALNMPFNASVHIMAGAGHLPHWRDPDGIAKLVAGG